MKALPLAILLFSIAGCATPVAVSPRGAGPSPAEGTRTLIAERPGGRVARIEANWKERLSQPYVFLEHRGDYRRLGDSMRLLCEECGALGLRPEGAPFALFFDDPRHVPAAKLRARACLPVGEVPTRLGALKYEVLPRAMVVYAQVSGDYPEVASCYPELFSFLRQLGWEQGGPVREVYRIQPAGAGGQEQVLTEVQIPWARQGGSGQ